MIFEIGGIQPLCHLSKHHSLSQGLHRFLGFLPTIEDTEDDTHVTIKLVVHSKRKALGEQPVIIEYIHVNASIEL